MAHHHYDDHPVLISSDNTLRETLAVIYERNLAAVFVADQDAGKLLGITDTDAIFRTLMEGAGAGDRLADERIAEHLYGRKK